MNDKINIKGEKFSVYLIDLINGEKGKKTIDENFIILARALEHPNELPYLIEDLFDLNDYKYIDDLRFALVRIQIYCDMNLNHDMEHFQRLSYVAQTIENTIFGELLVEGADLEEVEIDRRKKQDSKKKSSKSKSKKK